MTDKFKQFYNELYELCMKYKREQDFSVESIRAVLLALSHLIMLSRRKDY